MAALGALLVPVAAPIENAAAAAKRPSPVVTSVAPLEAGLGDTLTLRGRQFKRGRAKNTVVFKRDGGRAVFVKADLATTKMLKVRVPEKLGGALIQREGFPVPTRFRLRVLSERLGNAFTSTRLSPMIGPARPPGPPPASAPEGDCDADKIPNRTDPDDDNDLLADTTEKALKLDGCKVDSDDDKVEDGYEYKAASDLNDDEDQDPNSILPYPAKRPYPNPLFADAGVDYDGDSLTLADEHALWKYTVAHGAPRDLSALAYSDGERYSLSARTGNGRRVPTQPAGGYGKHQEFLAWAGSAGYGQVALQDPGAEWYAPRAVFDIRDFNRDGQVSVTAAPTLVGEFYDRAEATYYDQDEDGFLSDDERDEDADGMSNWSEARNCMQRSYWDKWYNKETPYYREFAATALDDEDSDGDGIRDGADDQDNDDLPNMMECSRVAASGRPYDSRKTPPEPPNPSPRKGHINPFNPCLPAKSRACNYLPPVDSAWAPFAENDKYYYVWN